MSLIRFILIVIAFFAFYRFIRILWYAFLEAMKKIPQSPNVGGSAKVEGEKKEQYHDVKEAKFRDIS